MSQVNRVRGLSDTLSKLRVYLDQLERENESLESQRQRNMKTAEDAAWVEEQKAKLARLLADLEKQGGVGGIKGVEPVRDDKGNYGLRIDDAVLFAAGKTAISKSGRETLARLLPILNKGQRVVRVDGHTDPDPIVKSKWTSNLHLSAQRALAVADVLHEQGIPYERLLVSGLGPTRPAPNATDKARHRRVELYLQ